MRPRPIFYHSPCFDGVTTAVILIDYLKTRDVRRDIDLRPVNYDSRATWLQSSLPRDAAVLDFLYHPGASIWIDHHQTTFLSESLWRHYCARATRLVVYDPTAYSCARVLQRYLAEHEYFESPAKAELVDWADRIDGARYESVEDAVFPTTPATTISWSLMGDGGQEYSKYLIAQLLAAPLSAVAALEIVKKRTEAATAHLHDGLLRFGASARLEDDLIVVFDVDATGTTISRYFPFLIFPEARYSVGALRNHNTARITAMRNPWLDFRSVPLGTILERFGGGGHERVASLVLPLQAMSHTGEVLSEVLRHIRNADAAMSAESNDRTLQLL